MTKGNLAVEREAEWEREREGARGGESCYSILHIVWPLIRCAWVYCQKKLTSQQELWFRYFGAAYVNLWSPIRSTLSASLSLTMTLSLAPSNVLFPWETAWLNCIVKLARAAELARMLNWTKHLATLDRPIAQCAQTTRDKVGTAWFTTELDLVI